MRSMMSLSETSRLIESGARLLIAADETLLSALPRGEWVGGTTPYFMGDEGGVVSREIAQVVVLPESVTAVSIRFYDADQLSAIPADYVNNGFAYVVLPGFTETHQRFAKDCSTWPGVFDRPLVGWVTGVNLKDFGSVLPKVFHGLTGEASHARAVVMHAHLAEDTFARVDIINLFHRGDGDTITVPETTFEVSECLVNGQPRRLAEYMVAHGISQKRPLVADYTGAMVNACVRQVDVENGMVSLYAPVFPGVEYRFADPLRDYEQQFQEELSKSRVDPVFSCNCILNFLYARLEGRKTGHLVGPITFGEIAYMLLNQTLVYLTFEKKQLVQDLETKLKDPRLEGTADHASG